MLYRRRLRSRIVLSFLLLGTLLSALFAISTLALQNYLEDQLIGATLARELDDYVGQLQDRPFRGRAFLHANPGIHHAAW